MKLPEVLVQAALVPQLLSVAHSTISDIRKDVIMYSQECAQHKNALATRSFLINLTERVAKTRLCQLRVYTTIKMLTHTYGPISSVSLVTGTGEVTSRSVGTGSIGITDISISRTLINT